MILFDAIAGKQTSKCGRFFHVGCGLSEKNTDSDTDDQSWHVCCCCYRCCYHYCCCCCCCCCFSCCCCCRLGCDCCLRCPVVYVFFSNAVQFVYWSVLITNSGELHQTTGSILFVISFHSAPLHHHHHHHHLIFSFFSSSTSSTSSSFFFFYYYSLFFFFLISLLRPIDVQSSAINSL